MSSHPLYILYSIVYRYYHPIQTKKYNCIKTLYTTTTPINPLYSNNFFCKKLIYNVTLQ